ncbi:hypothetical protein BGZ52_006398, partial [Haplosporangium bisporale]
LPRSPGRHRRHRRRYRRACDPVSTPTHPRIIELEGKMKNGIRLSVEESSELGQLNSAATAVNTNSASPLLVKRDSCPIVPETISAPC